MDAADTIRNSIADVTALRRHRMGDPSLAQAVQEVKELQSRRFTGTYADLMADPMVQPATHFFLEELYSPGDFSDRDDQFGRIAGTLQTVFPKPVVQTAVSLALLHAQTEELDHAMGHAWRDLAATPGEAARYARAWRAVGERPARHQQLASVIAIGEDLTRLTRMPGLRTLLHMMRRPARAAGLGALQRFLESGFDTFGELARQRGAVERFLATVQERESRLMQTLFEAPAVACETELTTTLGQAR
ncbi:FFLEELY motif protein [Simplicispira lacusdiani]|uniref:FFLEELY motif protein n=1 Tax=Simplicispira lacusdiani TaxID=2213010 RepID=UPI000E764191|nr:hypothetical protein [Simplicispira lacusdiani]